MYALNEGILYLVQKLIDEIEHFQGNLDHVTNLGRRLVSANENQPHLEHQVELQLSSLRATFSSLNAATSHVKV